MSLTAVGLGLAAGPAAAAPAPLTTVARLAARPGAPPRPGPAPVTAGRPPRLRRARRLLRAPHPVRLPAAERAVCPVPAQPGQMSCQSVLLIRDHAGRAAAFAAATAPVPGYGPASLQDAYGLTSASASKGRGETVAIVDAYRDPDAAGDLVRYRSHFRLPSCTTRSGCLRIVNQAGQASPLPEADYSWSIEESLDLDMVSAICPRCRILLVEARSASITDLATAEDTAAASGARFVSNSWNGGEFTGQDSYSRYFNHPGDAIAFASGDYGYSYGPAFPTDTQYVTAVGGTTLRHVRSGRREWTETVWGTDSGGTGSGCSALEAKPSWQRADATAPRGCLNRTENDVAAVADPATGVTVYDSYQTGGTWGEAGGTSAATPIITSVYALAGQPARDTYPASYPYAHAARFNDVTSGGNGQCESFRQYLCHGERGYDGPTGLGTPRGTAGFSASGTGAVTLLDPGSQDAGVGTSLSLTVHAVDSDRPERSLAYRAAGLPPGTRIKSAAGPLNGLITGSLPAAPGTFPVTVTARDARTGRTGVTRFVINVIPSMTAPAASLRPGRVTADDGLSCLSAATDTAGTAVVMDHCADTQVAQQWEYLAGAEPGAGGELTPAAGQCLGRTGRDAVLQACDHSAGQQWEYLLTFSSAGFPTNLLVNPASGACLNGGPLADGTRVVLSACSSASSAYGQNWTLPSGPIRSGVSGLCLSAPASLATCARVAQESWQAYNGRLSSKRRCLTVKSLLDGARAVAAVCDSIGPVAYQTWLPGPGGQLINEASGRCLDAPGKAGRGTALVLQDCYGQPGEIWAFN